MTARTVIALGLLIVLNVLTHAQSNAARNISGAWVPMGGGRGVDPKIAPPPATPIALKPDYAKAYDARRAADAEATKRGQPPATPAVESGAAPMERSTQRRNCRGRHSSGRHVLRLFRFPRPWLRHGPHLRPGLRRMPSLAGIPVLLH